MAVSPASASLFMNIYMVNIFVLKKYLSILRHPFVFCCSKAVKKYNLIGCGDINLYYYQYYIFQILVQFDFDLSNIQLVERVGSRESKLILIN